MLVYFGHVLRKIILIVTSLFRLARAIHKRNNYEYIYCEILNVILSFSAFFGPKYFPCYSVVNKTLDLCFSITARDHLQAHREYEVKLV